MHKKRKVWILAPVFGLILLIVVGSGFSVTAERGGPEPIRSFERVQPHSNIIFNDNQYRNAEELWSLEARQAAEPLAWNPVISEEAKGTSDEQEPLTIADLGGLPDRDAIEQARKQFPETWKEIDALLAEQESQSFMQIEGAEARQRAAAGIESLAAPYGTAAVYDTYMGNKWGPLWQKYPHIAVGKLYIDGGGYCSASVLSPKDYSYGYDIIVTAAHCVYDPSDGSWMDGWVFVPSDRKGVAPFGLFDWAWARVLGDWQSTGSRRYDVALIGLDKNCAGYQVTQYTGYLGHAHGGGATQHVFSTGYPSNLAGAGKWTHICAAETFSGGTDVIGMGCDMTYGSSGGPWLYQYEYYPFVPGNWVWGVVSGGTPGSNTFYAPQFTNNNIQVLCGAIGGCY